MYESKKTLRSLSFEPEHWALQALEPLFEDQWITEVLHRVKPGKDATVFCCRAHPRTGLDLIAAKVFRPKRLRTMQNDSVYRAGSFRLDNTGKALKDRRSRTAMTRKTRYGQKLEAHAWTQNEYRTLQRLHAAGADVPKPLACHETVLLMEFLGEVGSPAPALHRYPLQRDAAEAHFERLLVNLEIFLAHQVIHGDLSPYNILVWQGKLFVIDFPQAVHPAVNPSALFFFQRDLERVCQHFARFGIRRDVPSLAEELWARFLGPFPGWQESSVMAWPAIEPPEGWSLYPVMD